MALKKESIMDGSVPLFEFYDSPRGIIFHQSSGLSKKEIIKIIKSFLYKFENERIFLTNTSKQNKKWKKRELK